MASKNISMAVIRRLPKYYRYLGDLLSKDIQRISSKELSDIIGFTASQIRQDLNNFGGFKNAGFEIKALFDANPKVIGLKIRDFEILDSDLIEEYVKENNIEIGILCVPKNGAQQLADRLVGSGVKGIWNFAPVDLNVSKDVIVESVNLTESLFTLSYLMNEECE